MSFDPERWLQVADVCCIKIPKVDTEALLRTAENRAYYAALLSVRKRIEEAQGPGTVPSSRTHEAIFQAVGTGGDQFEEIYRVLLLLRAARDRADYELNAPAPKYEAVVDHVRRCRWLIRNRINAMRDEEYRRLKVPRP
ncbi:MAG TPA: hypothetical protein VF746_31770 [Longimicrobium sp.]|jgi:hypothetical protein